MRKAVAVALFISGVLLPLAAVYVCVVVATSPVYKTPDAPVLGILLAFVLGGMCLQGGRMLWRSSGEPSPTDTVRKYRKSTWGLVIWTVVMAVWIVAGASSASNTCSHNTSSVLSQQTYSSLCGAGAGIGIVLLGGLWFMGFLVGTAIWFMSRPTNTVAVFGPTGQEATGSEGVAVASPTASGAETKTCPQCAEEVKAAARMCRYCRYEFPEPPQEQQREPEVGTRAADLPAVYGHWEALTSNVEGIAPDDEVALSLDDNALVAWKPGDEFVGDGWWWGSIRIVGASEMEVRVYSGEDLLFSLDPIDGDTERLVPSFPHARYGYWEVVESAVEGLAADSDVALSASHDRLVAWTPGGAMVGPGWHAHDIRVETESGDTVTVDSGRTHLFSLRAIAGDNAELVKRFPA